MPPSLQSAKPVSDGVRSPSISLPLRVGTPNLASLLTFERRAAKEPSITRPTDFAMPGRTGLPAQFCGLQLPIFCSVPANSWMGGGNCFCHVSVLQASRNCGSRTAGKSEDCNRRSQVASQAPFQQLYIKLPILSEQRGSLDGASKGPWPGLQSRLFNSRAHS